MILAHKAQEPELLLKQDKQKLIHKGFLYDGHNFQIDDHSLLLISGRALKLTRKQLAGIPLPNVEWRTTGNTFVEFTGEEFLAFAEAAEQYYESILRSIWEVKDRRV